MRKPLIILAMLALPVHLSAQEAPDAAFDAPAVQLEQSVTPAGSATATAVDGDTDRAELPAVEARTSVDEPVAVQEDEIGSRQWWYVVGAVVVGGLILALIL